MNENELVVRKVSDVVQNEMTSDILENIKSRIQAPSGDKVQVTQYKKFKMPDGTETDGPIDAVIVDFVSANVFYKSGFDPGDMGPPDCFAIHPEPSLLVPSANSPDRQADSCAVCPNNQFGSKGKGKACKNTKLLAIMPADGASEDTPIWTLRISPTGIRGFDDYVRGLAHKGVVTLQVKSKIGFNKDVSYPSLKFMPVGPVSAEDYPHYESKLFEARERLLTEPDVSQATTPKVVARGRK